MSILKRITNNKDSLLMVLTGLIILFGIVIRVIFFLQNRNLFIDEANVARNIYERSFTGLLSPLSYEQYAPPLYLWAVKLFTLVAGYSEYAFRAVSLISGILSIFLLLDIFKRTSNAKVYWYPLFLFANAFILLHYSAEVKQYMSDVLATLALIWLALRIDINEQDKGRFALLWSCAGSAAIWMSMPSVFTLVAVGCYYFYKCLEQRNYRKIIPLVVIVSVWIVQFAFYYIVILKPQVDSQYLQNFHKDYFLFLNPLGRGDFKHNYYIYKEFAQELGGHSSWSFWFNSIFLVIGIIIFLIKDRAKSLLFIIPVIMAVIAGGLDKYSFTPRLILFLSPLFLVLIAVGLNAVISKKNIVVNVVVIGFAIVSMYTQNSLRLIRHPWKFETITESLQFLKDNDIDGGHTYVHNGARPAFIYYTQIHPSHDRWVKYRTAHLLWWDASYGQIADTVKGKAGFVFTSIDSEGLAMCKHELAARLKEQAEIEIPERRCFVYIYQSK